MPSFTTQVQNLRQNGPIVSVKIIPSAIYTRTLGIPQEEIPEPIEVWAMVDTGATGTVIQQGVPQQLGLQPVGFTRISTASEQNIFCLLYDLQIILQSNVSLNARVAEIPLRGQNIQCLIGRDILSKAVLIYNGYVQTFTLSI